MITTSEARLKLFELMECAGASTFYTDTDSIVYHVEDLAQDPLASFKNSYLGGLTDEIGADWEIIDFVAPGAKQYSILKRNVNTGEEKVVTKIRGFTLDPENKTKFTHEKFQNLVDEMIQNRQDPHAPKSEIISRRPEMKRHAAFGGIEPIVQEKRYRVCNRKGVLQDNGCVYPYGYSGIV